MIKTGDLVVKSSDDNVALIVEVKARSHVSDEWASTLRRNFVAHQMVPSNAFFLLALKDYFYLWKPGNSRSSAEFDYKISANSILDKYLDRLSLADLSESSLELLLSTWLGDLANSRISEDENPEFASIIKSGLYEAIKGGAVQAQVAD
ncbi:MAG: hypothetical protein IH872_07280 [Chloroflexi bacterium]|nr:hypothetical protein [Chloroflexota bacterium]